jgi:hypothetical protein
MRGNKVSEDSPGIDAVIAEWRSKHPRAPTRAQPSVLRTRRGISSIFLLFLAGLTVVLLFQTGILPMSGCGTVQDTPAVRRVALIDSLSVDMPNPSFVNDISSLSSSAGYSLDYYPPEKLSFSILTHLPEMGYSILVFRTHGVFGEPVVATSMTYSSHAQLVAQLRGDLGRVQVSQHQYFGIMPGFVTGEMCGRFPGTVVLGMGCSSLISDGLAKAFVEKGARSFVGWNGWVTQGHTDTVFANLVKLLLSGEPVGQAVDNTMKTIGPDGSTGSAIIAYPS